MQTPEEHFFAISKKIQNLITPSNAEIPGSLYHFTGTEGFLGITQNHGIFATHWKYLNDRSEGKYGEAVIRRVSRRLKEKTSDQKSLRLLDSIEGFLPGERDFYVTCFSEKDDHSGQWMEYGDRGRGFCIGFAADAIAKMPTPSLVEGNSIFVKVLYDTSEQENIIEELINTAIGGLSENIDFGGCTAVDEGLDRENVIAGLLNDQLLKMYFAMKDHRFSDEQEWRLIQISSCGDESQIHFRAGSYGLTPHMVVKSGYGEDSPSYLPISSIRSGPAADQEAVSRSLETYLRRSPYFSVDRRFSDLPLRLV